MARDLREFVAQVEQELPAEYVCVSRKVRPTKFEVTALLETLAQAGYFPMVEFKNTEDVHGNGVDIPIISNVFASRKRCALALGHDIGEKR